MAAIGGLIYNGSFCVKVLTAETQGYVILDKHKEKQRRIVGGYINTRKRYTWPRAASALRRSMYGCLSP